MNIAIIGGGIAGLTTAWLLSGQHQVRVFEARSRVGGHADSLSLDATPIRVDLGAHYLSPQAFPQHSRVLTALGIGPDQLVAAPLTFTLSGPASPLLVSPHAPDQERLPVTGEAWEAVTTLLRAALGLQAREHEWTSTVAELVEPLAVSPALKDQVLYPLCASSSGCSSVEQAKELSAQAATASLLLVPPASPEHAPLWVVGSGGMQEVAFRLCAALAEGVIQTDTPITTLMRAEEQFVLTDAIGHSFQADHVVLATSAEAALPLLAQVAGTRQLRQLLAQFPYTPAVLALHRGPTYMLKARQHWSVVNVEVHDGWAETSHWYGPIHGLEVFKSWITYREQPPTEILSSRAFRHLLVTPAAVRARNALASLQGVGGLSFVGSYLSGIDSQESAVVSALQVASKLAPQAPRVQEVLLR